MARYVLVSGDFVMTGGMDRANHALAAYLADQGHEVHLVAFRAADDLTSRPNVTLHRAAKPLNSYMLAEPVLAREGRRIAREMAGPGTRVLVNGGNCPWPDANWLHHVHGSDSPLAGGSFLHRLKTRYMYRKHVEEEKRIVPGARVVIATCEKTRRDAIEKIGVDPKKIHVAYLGVDAETFRPARPGEREASREALGWAPGRPKVGFVGALADRRKGFDRLFAAWIELCKSPDWDADLMVVGRGAEVPLWKERAEAAGLADRIAFLGFVPDLAAFFRALDAHCLPSRYEGYSLVTQEALCCGVPAFVSRASGIAEKYPETLSQLVLDDPEDAAELVGKLRDWRARMAEYRSMIGPLTDDLRSITWEVMSARIAQLIEGPGA